MISRVDESVWRGPRPEPSDFVDIKEMFSTVLSLEGEAEDQKEKAELAPVPVISQPISAFEIYITGISQPRLEEILGTIRMERKPLLVHCEHGEDRTGLIIACYRVSVCGWSKEMAMAEALKYGYRGWLNFGINKTWSAYQ